MTESNEPLQHPDAPQLPFPEEQNGISPEDQATPEQPLEPDDPIEAIVQGIDRDSVDEEKLEDLIDQHPLVRELASDLRSLRKVEQYSVIEEAQKMTAVKEVRQTIGKQIKDKLGIVEVDSSAAARQAEAERLQKLSGILVGLTHQESEDELLVKFGLVNDEGRITEEAIKSPLFRGDTSAAFGRYMRYVLQFTAMEQAEAMSGIRMANIQTASNLRGIAHDAVASMVERDLGLPFPAARRFIAKARDAKVPGSGEKHSYAELLASERVASSFNHDAAAFTRDSLKDIINRPMDNEK